MDASDIEVGQRWMHKRIPKLVARISNDNGKSVQLELGSGFDGRWVTYEVLREYWELVDAPE